MIVVCETCGIKLSVDLEKLEKGQQSIVCDNCDERISLQGLLKQAKSGIDGDIVKKDKPTLMGALAAAEKTGKSEKKRREETDGDSKDGSKPGKRSPRLEIVKGLDEPDPVVIELKGGKPPKEKPTTWHVFLEGDWRGPYDADEIAALVKEGRLDRDSKCWRDGLDDWSSLVDFEELAKAMETRAPKHKRATPPPPATSEESPKNGGDEIDAKQPTAEEREKKRASAYKSGSDEAERTTQARRDHESDGEADLFKPYDEDAGGDTPSTRTSSTPTPLPARTSDSVLFDRYRLEAFSEGKGSYPPYSEENDDEDRQDSGLIDIKNLAAEVDRPARATAADELVNVGGGGFGALTLGHSEDAKDEHPRDRLTMAIFFMGAVILIAIGVQIYLALRGETESEEQPMMVIMLPPDPDGEVETLIVRPGVGTQRVKGRPDQLLAGTLPPEVETESNDLQTPAPEVEASSNENAEGEEDELDELLGLEEQEHADENHDDETDRRDEQLEARSNGRSSEERTEREPDQTSASAQSNESRSDDERRSPTKSTRQTSTNDEALYGQSQGREPWEPDEATKNQQSAGDPSLPETLSKVQVQAGMNTVADDVRRCAVSRTGTIMIHAKISGEFGRVTSARVTGDFAGTPEGSCAARAARRARFPRFRQKSLAVQYPFRVY